MRKTKTKKKTIYEKYIKRCLDFILSLIAIILLSPIFLILIILGTIFMKGNPFFVQKRPGKNEKIFKLIKFRTMSNAKDKNGKLLPDEKRLNKYGKFLRSTSLDELPELFNILIGNMAIVGPRPQLVRDMVFMSKEHRKRHNVRPGLTGLAQVSGRNALKWDNKLDTDLIYIENITFANDVKIIFKTISTVFKKEGITEEGMATAADYGDYLLSEKKITKKEYNEKQKEALKLLGELYEKK